MKHSTGKIGLFPLMPALAMAALFTACGDEITEVTQVNESAGIEVLVAGDTLGDCTKDNVGEMLFVTDSSAVFYCADGKWQTLNGKDGSKGSDGENGKDGKPGENGKNGDDGSSCTAKTVEEGIEVSCGGKVVGTIKNGDKGDDGLSCSVTQNGDETTITCETADGKPVSYVVKNGENGKSAYELSGTDMPLEQWLASLKGDNGLSCSAMQNGDETTITCETADGKPVSYVVKNGENGKSAYELSGTDMPLEQWLASLKGDNGLSCSVTQNGDETTITCETANGDVSYEVANGMSTYEIAVEAGFQGSEAEWLESLKGDKGDDGVGCEVSRNGYELTITCANSKEVVDLRDFIVEADPDVTPGTVPGSNSSSSEVKPDGFYSNSKNCPAGLVCKYATKTEYLNSTKTYGEFLDTRDGQVYKTITIGTQTWMAQNLNFAYTGVKFNYDGNTSDSTSWCYSNDPSYCATYGRLYTWAAAMDSAGIVDKNGAGKGCGCGVFCTAASSETRVRGVCPSGWHLPSNDEWSTLYTKVGGTGTAGKMLKSNTSLWFGTGTNEYGFSVLPAGYRYYFNGHFNLRGDRAYFWSSTEYEDISDDAWFQDFDSGYDYVNQNLYSKSDGFSVRCLKD